MDGKRLGDDVGDLHARVERLERLLKDDAQPAAQQAQFVEVFSDFLCRYYISRLQLYYAGESVTFVAQEMKSPTRAIVSVVLHWQSMDIPVEVRMVKRDEQWRAFDLAVSGISAVLVYRAQFQPILLRESPQFLIETLQQRIAEQG